MKRVNNIILWIFTIIFLVTGVIGLFNDPLPGATLLLIGLVLLPPLTAWFAKLNFRPKWWIKGIIITVLIIAFGVVSEPTENNNPANNSKGTLSPSVTIGNNSGQVSSSSVTATPSTTTSSKATPAPTQKPDIGQLKLHFIDVGQADSILIQAPGGKVMLIDAGNNGDATTVTNYIKTLGINKIDIIVGTHPHEDHVGGMDEVINTFNIGSIYMPKVSNTTKTFEDVLTAVKNKGLQVNTAAAGVKLDLGVNINAEMFAPNGTSYEDLNVWSAVVKIIFGNNNFLLTGDAEAVSEKEMIAKGFDLKADLLKVGHHGSSSSSSAEFLSKVNPKYAVISVGIDNDYGHPHKTTMQKLQERGIAVYRTDQNKTIIATSDGNNITFNTDPGNYNPGDGTQASTGGNAVTQPTNNTKTVYYTPTGKSYHYRKDCSTLSRSKTILEGPLQDVINAGHADPCDVCVK